MEVYKAGTKMQAEKNLSYEPGLLIEMEKITRKLSIKPIPLSVVRSAEITSTDLQYF